MTPPPNIHMCDDCGDESSPLTLGELHGVPAWLCPPCLYPSLRPAVVEGAHQR